MRLKLLFLLAVAVVLSGLLELKRKPASRNCGEPPDAIAVAPDTISHSVQVAI